MAICAVALAGVGACGGSGAQGDLAALGEPNVTRVNLPAPPGAAPGSCWGRHTSPAVIETVTRQVIVQPAKVRADGTVATPAVFRTETNQEIVRERQETWFQTPCEAQMTEEFIASVQRALQVRGVYRGNISGQMDHATRAAVRRFQKPQGLDTGILALETARQLGLVAIESDAAG